MTRTAAAEYVKAGIRVNVACPGFIQTPMVERAVAAVPALESRRLERMPIGRFGTPKEVAGAVVWLCSDDATLITGHALAIDGGMLA